MDRVSIDLTVGDYTDIRCNSFTIDTGDINTIIRTAKVSISKKDRGKVKIGNVFKISAGYFPVKTPLFSGYISDIQEDDKLVELYCEDEGWKAKQMIVEEATEYNTTVRKILDKYYKGVYVIFLDKNQNGDIGDIKFDGTPTFFDVLQMFRERYGIISYFSVVGILHVDMLRQVNDTIIDAEYGKNVIDGFDGLKNVNDDARKRIIYGVSRQNDDTYIKRWGYVDENGNIKIESKAKKDGYIDKIEINNVKASELEKYIALRLSKGVFTGFSGEIPMLFTKLIKPFDKINLIDRRNIYKGLYLCTRVVYNFDYSTGLIQNITIGHKL
jgi:hypothetical protein